MAEFLLFWKAHWMDSLTPQEVAELSPEELLKYNARYQWGDIVEVRPDGYWDNRGFDTDAFSVVKVSGMAVDREHVTPLMNEEVVLKRSKWSFPMAKIPPAILVEINAMRKTVVSLAQFQNIEVLVRAQRNIEGFVPPKLEPKAG